MLRHIVLFKWKPNVSREERDKLIADLKSLPLKIDVIRAYEVAEDVLHEPRSFDLAVMALFDDVEMLRRYQAHPEHVPIATRLRESGVQSVAVDYII